MNIGPCLPSWQRKNRNAESLPNCNFGLIGLSFYPWCGSRNINVTSLKGSKLRPPLSQKYIVWGIYLITEDTCLWRGPGAITLLHWTPLWTQGRTLTFSAIFGRLPLLTSKTRWMVWSWNGLSKAIGKETKKPSMAIQFDDSTYSTCDHTRTWTNKMMK